MKLADETFGQAWMMTIPSGPDINDEERGHWYSPSAVAQFVADEREACAKTCEALKYKHEYVRACVDAIRMRSNAQAQPDAQALLRGSAGATGSAAAGPEKG